MKTPSNLPRLIADRMSKGAVLLADKMYFALQEREEQGEIGR